MISPELLRRFPFFNFMDDPQLKVVATLANQVNFEKDEQIVEAGKPADNLYFLIDGSVGYYFVVTTEHDPYYKKEYFISHINPGEVFGISALIEPYVYTATLRADKASRVIKIDASALRALCEVDTRLSCGLHKAMARAAMERLQLTRVQLVAETAAKPRNTAR
ncbi:MAG TPA: Crp/Fnr family transcriptional regulator [Anaerolineales bacterium]|nr:Crp/Fnr family transcriptional regulator [Anaerolineales bacterium]